MKNRPKISWNQAGHAFYEPLWFQAQAPKGLVSHVCEHASQLSVVATCATGTSHKSKTAKIYINPSPPTIFIPISKYQSFNYSRNAYILDSSLFILLKHKKTVGLWNLADPPTWTTTTTSNWNREQIYSTSTSPPKPNGTTKTPSRTDARNGARNGARNDKDFLHRSQRLFLNLRASCSFWCFSRLSLRIFC